MAFRFSLESILRLRRGEQRQQELILLKANEQVNRISAELGSLNDEIQDISSGRKQAAQITGAEIRFDDERCEILAGRRAQIEVRLQNAQEERAIAIKDFQRIWQRREALETLRQHEHQAYALEESRREQRAQDDLFLRRKQKR